MRIRTIEIVELGERVKFACDGCRSEALHELRRPDNRSEPRWQSSSRYSG